jgi:2-methylcitrate dehydratase PrpD
MRLVVVDDHGAPKKLPPCTHNEAQFSMPFTIALAAVKGAVFTEVLTDTALDDPDVLRMFDKISISATAEKDALQQAEGYPPDDVKIASMQSDDL